jgi:protein-tyrosine phosphatase
VAPDLKVSYPKSEQIAHKVLPAVDEDDYDLSQHFEEASAFIDRNRSKTNVLVHCQAGVSRSTTIVIAYLMWKFGWNTSQAYSTVKSGRRLTCPNFGFCRQLKAYEKLLFGESDKQVSSASTIDDSCYRKDPPRSSRYLRDNADCSKSTIAT